MNIKLEVLNSMYFEYSPDWILIYFEYYSYTHDFTTFDQIWFESSISKSLCFRVVYLSKSWLWRIPSCDYFSSHFWNVQLTDIKMALFRMNDFTTFIQIWLEPMISRILYFRGVYFLKSRLWYIADWKYC